MKEAIVLYDSECQFCNNWICFVKTKLKNEKISFITLNSSKAIQLLKDFKIVNEDSVIYIKGDVFYLKSRAILKICSQLKSPYTTLQHLNILPVSLLDYCYNFIAKRRLHFNPRKQCCND